MNSRELDLLERVFSAEINGAFGGSGILQIRSKLAHKLESDGYLKKVEFVIEGRFPVKVSWYVLTLLGNLTYCTSNRCHDDV